MSPSNTHNNNNNNNAHAQVLPGLLLCFAMRFDSLCPPAGSGTAIASGSITRLRMCFQRWTYFTTALSGYAVGLIMASIVVDITGAAQPALLYLVPTTLIPLLLKATVQVCECELCVCACVSRSPSFARRETLGQCGTAHTSLHNLQNPTNKSFLSEHTHPHPSHATHHHYHTITTNSVCSFTLYLS